MGNNNLFEEAYADALEDLTDYQRESLQGWHKELCRKVTLNAVLGFSRR